VDVLDPQSNRAYVLLPVELFQHIRTVLPEVVAPHSTLPAEVTRGEPIRIKLRELATPPEVAERVRRICKKLGFWRRRYAQEVEDEAKLSYYFGGQYVAYLKSKDGPIVVAAGRQASEEFQRQLGALLPEERRTVIKWLPSVWNDTVSQL
jgi:hypothetical protein